MVNQILLLRSLTPPEALRLLAQATATAGVEGLEEVRLQTWTPPETPSELRVNLAIPNLRQKHKAGQLKFYQMLDGEYRKLQIGDVVEQPLPQSAESLRAKIPALLRASAYNDRPARRLEQEYLIVVPAVDMKQAAEILVYLSLRATTVSVAPMVPHELPQPLHIFRVLDDQQRDSAFRSMIQSEIISPLLVGYEAGDRVFFADTTKAPGSETLRAFAELVRNAPTLLGYSETQNQVSARAKHPLAALVEWPGATPVLELLNLAGLRFINQVAVEPHPLRYSMVIVSDLRNSPGDEQKLREAVNVAALNISYQVGYTLTLKDVREPTVLDLQRERARLQTLKEDLENRLEYLDSIEAPRPFLLRFTEEQLPALGEYVGSFAMRVIEAGLIRYASQSLEVDGAGMHFLLIDPTVAYKEKVDPLPAWRTSADPPSLYWLDPYWARYYHGRGESLVFVPRETYLSPMMHPPSANAIDAYLRAIVGQWFANRGENAPKVPKHPLYMFEPAGGSRRQLTIRILDADAFVPLKQKLDWINTNLYLQEARQGGDVILQRIVAEMSSRDVLEIIDREAEHRKHALDRTLQQSTMRVAGATGMVSNVLSATLQSVLQESKTTREAIATAQAELQRLIATQAEINATLHNVNQAISAADNTVTQATATTEDLRKRVEDELHKAETARADAERKISRLEALIISLSNRLSQP